MQRDDLFEKKVALDEHINFVKEQLLYTDDPVETRRLIAVLDDLVAEQLQLEDYLGEDSYEPQRRSPSGFHNKYTTSPNKEEVWNSFGQRYPTKPLVFMQIGNWIRPRGGSEWFRVLARYPEYTSIVGEDNNQTMHINRNRYNEPWEYRE
ncbi:Hypothetical protein BQ3484_530 [Cedratvirus A11]|uniref:Uncharacterized protein n=1 Tax=Cedratvirus A11 TaxID=1903266 RepID=A0A1M7XVP3_9VIRU|nr:Hypothetical protein BQ3484_530 [Cedratvirus A11]SHO33598.1 Hypothetical protein BQ3484_530 [Cedratvirus A11]